MTDKAAATFTQSKVTALTLIVPVHISYLSWWALIVAHTIDANRCTSACDRQRELGRKCGSPVLASGQPVGANKAEPFGGIRLLHSCAVHQKAGIRKGKTVPRWGMGATGNYNSIQRTAASLSIVSFVVCVTRQFWLIPTR